MENNLSHVPVNGVIPLNQMWGDDEEDLRLLGVMASDAQTYLQNFSWCKSIREVYFGDGYGGIVAVFLFRIEPIRADIDEWLWVVYGDLPPAYLVTDSCKQPSQALESYVEEMMKWVDLAMTGQTSKAVIQVDREPTPENAELLVTKLKFIQENMIPTFRASESIQG